MSVSSSQGLTSIVTIDFAAGFSLCIVSSLSGERLASGVLECFLGLVCSKIGLALSDNFRVLLFIVGAEKIDLVVILGRILGVLGYGDSLGAVGGVWLGRVAGKCAEFVNVGSDVSVPSVGLRCNVRTYFALQIRFCLP